MATERALRTMREQLCEVSVKLAAARREGGYKQIRFWLDRREDLLERLALMTKQPAQEGSDGT
jgi:hypothetical protein